VIAIRGFVIATTYCFHIVLCQTNHTSNNSNKLTNQMQQFHKFYYLTLLCRSTCFGRLHAHYQELTTELTASGFTSERGGSSVVGRGLTGQTTTNNVATTTFRGKIRGC
jgi:hypothetical protein